MGLSSSRMGPAPSRLAGTRRRRSWIRRTLSSLFICGVARETGDCPAELLVDSAEHCSQGKLELPRVDIPCGCGADLAVTKTATTVSPGICLVRNPALQLQASNVDAGNKGEYLFERREGMENSETASASDADQPLSGCVSATEIVALDSISCMNSSASGGSSQVIEAQSISNSLHSHGLEEPLSSEVSSESNVSEAIGFSNSECSSIVSDSPTRLGMQNWQAVSLVSGDDTITPSNISSGNHAAINSRESRSSRRLFRDAFSRRNYRRMIDSRSFDVPSDDSDHLRPADRRHHDFSVDFIRNEHQGDIRSRPSRIQGSNDRGWNSRSEIRGRLHGTLDSIDHQTGTCPRGIHADGSCSCQSGMTAEESASRAGISRVVLLAEALLEVLDQIYRQPLMLSLSAISTPAPDSVVNSFPVKNYRKVDNECADDISQCYICLDEYEEGDKIRVLPCKHEYHASCVDKWLKEIHSVCPLCRGDVRQGLTGASNSEQEAVPP